MNWELYLTLVFGIMSYINIIIADGWWKVLWLIIGLWWCGRFIHDLEIFINEKGEI